MVPVMELLALETKITSSLLKKLLPQKIHMFQMNIKPISKARLNIHYLLLLHEATQVICSCIFIIINILYF